MGNFSKELKNWLLNGVKIQLLTATLSLPILVAWGLPISLMSIVGNLLAMPFLMTILMLSSLLFLTEITGIPNSYLCWITNKITYCWHSMLCMGSATWLVGISAPPHTVSLVLCVLTALSLFVLLKKYKMSMIGASLSTMSGYLIVCMLTQQQTVHNVDKIYCINRNGRKIVIDEGFFAYKTNYKSPARYQIKPLLYKNFGSNHVHRWHVTYAGVRSLRALNSILDEIKIDAISLKMRPKKVSIPWQIAWEELQKKCLNQKTKLHEPTEYLPER